MTLHKLGSTMRVLRPAPNVLAFYDGRIAGVRAWSETPNWLDDGAYALGACSYAILEGAEALVYDTHISLAHAAIIRAVLEEAGARNIRVVLSHWHADHVAGNAAFADCEIIANETTAAILADKEAALETGTPPIRPLVFPTRLFEDRLAFQVGGMAVELRAFDIHSRDGTVLILPDTGMLLAGDTLEDPITYVAEPDRLAAHLLDLERLSRQRFTRILPNHGDPEIIAAGGYDRSLLDATRRYVETLLRLKDDPALARADLRTVIGRDLAEGSVHFYPAYESVHRQNVERVLSQG